MFAVGVLTVGVMLGVIFCLWKRPDPHHQQIASLLALLDFEHIVGMPPAVNPIVPSQTRRSA